VIESLQMKRRHPCVRDSLPRKAKTTRLPLTVGQVLDLDLEKKRGGQKRNWIPGSGGVLYLQGMEIGLKA